MSRPCWCGPCDDVTNKLLSYRVHASVNFVLEAGTLDSPSGTDEEDDQRKPGLSEPSAAPVSNAYTSLGGQHTRG